MRQNGAELNARSPVVLGLGRQGKAMALYYVAHGQPVTVSDMRTVEQLQAALGELSGLPIRYVLGGHPLSLLDDCDLLVVSGGVSPDIPVVQEALARGIPVSNDAQEFMLRSPAPIVGISGSAGKTTTTSLVGSMLVATGLTTWVGGNIGNPLISDLDRIQASHRVVMELSSFQLELMTLSPQVAGILNITPNHLDRHKTMEAYLAAKRRIVQFQGVADTAVLGWDDPNARESAGYTRAQVAYFSGQAIPHEGACLVGTKLILCAQGEQVEICDRSDIRLRGYHNILNTLAAVALAGAAGASVDGMRQAIATFSGVEHRLEPVRRQSGVLWVNDSIATAPERVLAALSSFEEPIVLLAGGRDKDLPWEAFAERVIGRVRVLVLFGEAAGMIGGHVASAWSAVRREQKPVSLESVISVATLEEAVSAAAARAQKGDVVLLSPGGTSFDAFRDFEERGRRFRELVNAL